MPVNYQSQGERKAILDSILSSEENKRRKQESLKQFEIYKSRQHPMVVERIRKELSAEAARKSRVISSINLTPKIIDEMAKLYMTPPKRTWTDVSEEQVMHIEKLYECAKANVKLKKSQRVFKLQQQACLQVIPKDGKIEMRALYGHHYDVIPKSDDPEKAECYIISSYDKSDFFTRVEKDASTNPVLNRGYFSDSVNQKFGDPDDFKSNRFVWWTDEYNFVTNANGEILIEPDANGNQPDLRNPIGMLPFIDVAQDKDFEFFVRSGNSITDFALDFSVMLSDVAEVNRLQGFAQAIITSVEEPKDLSIGPRNYLWLKLDPSIENVALKPTFEFTAPSPDLSASLQMLSNYASLFLTSVGQSPKLVNASGEKESYASGLDRFLAMIDKFEQSKDDADMYVWVEKRVYELMKAWNNVYYNVTENGFESELSGVLLPESSEVQVSFKGPEMNMSENDKLDLIQKKMELGIYSRARALMDTQGLDEKQALEELRKIDAEQLLDEDVDAEVEQSDEPNPIGQ